MEKDIFTIHGNRAFTMTKILNTAFTKTKEDRAVY